AGCAAVVRRGYAVDHRGIGGPDLRQLVPVQVRIVHTDQVQPRATHLQATRPVRQVQPAARGERIPELTPGQVLDAFLRILPPGVREEVPGRVAGLRREVVVRAH